MSNLTVSNGVELALIQGDLSKLSVEQRLSYFKSVCESLSLNPLTKPFDFINLNGKLTLYTKRDATDQLRNNRKISITISAREKIEDVYIVTAKAKNPDGREDESTGAVNVSGLKGDALANAMMKAETKAKRRVTLSICGLGLLDESEIETIPDAKKVSETETNVVPMIQEPKVSPTKITLTDGDHIIKFGKFKGTKIEDVDIYELNNYVAYIEKKAEKDGKEITGVVLEFMTAANSFLASREVDDSEKPESWEFP